MSGQWAHPPPSTRRPQAVRRLGLLGVDVSCVQTALGIETGFVTAELDAIGAATAGWKLPQDSVKTSLHSQPGVNGCGVDE